MRVHIIVYAPRVGSTPDTALACGARMKKYLVVERGLKEERLTIIDGGFREKLSYKDVANNRRRETAGPYPTVSRKDVKLEGQNQAA